MSEETRTHQESEALDLAIILTQPLGGSPPEVLASVTLACDMLGLRHTGEPLVDPLTGREREDLRWYLEEYWKWPYLEFATRGRQVEAMLREIGKRLYQVVFGGREAQSILQAWNQQPGVQHQISIMSDSSRVLSLPWELLHDASGFLILDPLQPISIIRLLPQREQALVSLPLEPPLRILLITARPEGAGFIDARSIARELIDGVQAQVDAGAIELEFLRPPTFSNLRARLRDRKRPIHVLHFDGHGAFDDVKHGQGLLLFETEAGRPSPVQGSDLAKVLHDSGVRLAVLTACQSAMSAQDDAFSSVATQLIRHGIDAVVAMSSSILVASATRYAEVFYRALAAGVSVPTAQERTRQALHDDPRRHVFRRRDEEGTPVELWDWWVPHFYQQRKILLQPVRGEMRSSHELRLAPFAPHLSEEMPAAPRYGFSGRARELLQIERWLLREKLVVIHGFGGVGKTALVREAADWLTRTKMYGGTCFVSFEHGEDATWLLSALGNFLGVYDDHYNPSDPVAALTHLKPVLKERHILIIVDNLESVLPESQVPLEAEVRTQLWDVLLEVAKMGGSVLLTSRGSNFGDGRLLPGNQVAYLPLAGLDPEDAYELASRLLDDLSIDRTRAPYNELCNLLKDLDHHPLAIQLVLPALCERSLSQIKSGFVTLLSTFEDDMATGRNQSLLASLEYSLQRLSPAHRALLPRLAVFEGGASEDDLLDITQIPESEWAELRLALEQAALLTVEQVHQALKAPFLHFHPVLSPYLRSQPGTDETALLERYMQQYCARAIYLYQRDDRHPQPVRALVRRELPNLRRALALLLEAGEVDVASDMAERVVRFLKKFGLWRELNGLQRRIEEAIASKSATPTDTALTWAEYLGESRRAESELAQDNLRAAYDCFTQLLARIEAQSVGIRLGRGSYEHCVTLHRLARCLSARGQPVIAEQRLREALSVIEASLKGQPAERENYIHEHSVLLTDLGGVLIDQGKYPQAREAFEEALLIAQQSRDPRQQAVVQGELGRLAEMQGNYLQAKSRQTLVLDLFRGLDEPSMEAVAWHRLGSVAEEQEDWTEAERCYRESLALSERLGDTAGAAMTCNRLAVVARMTGRPSEAESWCKRALELYEQVQPGSPSHAGILNNLGGLLVSEVRTGRAPIARLVEARGYAEQALAILETLDASSGVWVPLGILVPIAEMEGRIEEARAYRRREREAFAAFGGNRYRIDQQFGLLLPILAAAQDNLETRAQVEEVLPKLEEKGWRISKALHRIWAGERDWEQLSEGLNNESALMILRVLETLQE